MAAVTHENVRGRDYYKNVVPEKPLAVAGERAVIEARLDHVHVEEPTKQHVVVSCSQSCRSLRTV